VSEENKDKEKKKALVLDGFSTISYGLSEAMKANAQILQSSVAQQALHSARVFDSFAIDRSNSTVPERHCFHWFIRNRES
jgi:hypothetical protein